MSEQGLPDAEDMYSVVMNGEEQYSIWPWGRKVPDGWQTVGDPADKTSCLAYIEKHWTDMRPLSARRAMDASGRVDA